MLVMQKGKKAYERHKKMLQCTAGTISMEYVKSVFTGICHLCVHRGTNASVQKLSDTHFSE